MRIYYTGERKNHQMVVAPAADPRAIKDGISADWVDDKGRPITFHIDFVGGMAEVSDTLGQYLIVTGAAKRTCLWLPKAFMKRAA